MGEGRRQGTPCIEPEYLPADACTSCTERTSWKRPPNQGDESIVDFQHLVWELPAGPHSGIKQDTKWELVSKFIKRNKGISAGLALALVILLGSLVFLLGSWRETRTAYTAFKKEQEAKEQRTREAVPAFVEAARLAVQQKQIDNALAHVGVALDYDPDHAEARLLKGQLLLSRNDFSAASLELDRYLKLRPEDAQTAQLAHLCAHADTDLPSVQADIGNLLVRQNQPLLAVGFFRSNEKRLPVYTQQIKKAWPDVNAARLYLDKDSKLCLVLRETREEKFLDLSPVRGIPLSTINLAFGKAHDLRPLQGMPLTSVSLTGLPHLKDLSPLKGMALQEIRISITGIQDLEPLRGMPIHTLSFDAGLGGMVDIDPLKDMPLTRLVLTAPVRDLSPLKGKHLQVLEVHAPIRDLTPLVGMPLTRLRIWAPLTDLTPLRELQQLQELDLYMTAVSDLSPLKGMPLRSLILNANLKIQDLRPLEALPLTELHLRSTGVRDLTPLGRLNLERITLPDPIDRLKGLELLQKMESLKEINQMSAAVFWKKYADGEFKTKP
jgi:hypothetical protein